MSEKITAADAILLLDAHEAAAVDVREPDEFAVGHIPGAKLLHLTNGISVAFASPLPSLHLFDLCVGVAGAVAVRLIVYSLSLIHISELDRWRQSGGPPPCRHRERGRHCCHGQGTGDRHGASG